MRLDRFLESQLSRSARTVRQLLIERQIALNGRIVIDGRLAVSKFCRVEAEGRLLQYREALYLMLHKPRGCVSATVDNKNPTVLDLIDLPAKNELHLAGRLDFNTTGLLLLTNDGHWSSRIMLPGQKLPKVYRVETELVITDEYVKQFAEGIYFRFENLKTAPAQLKILAPRLAEITLHEGRYHQIKRMFGFFQNRVTALHRLSIGPITLDEQLAPGSFRPLSQAEIASI